MKKTKKFGKQSEQHSHAQQRNKIKWERVLHRQEEKQQAQLQVEVSQTSLFINFLPALCSHDAAIRIAALTMLAGLCGMGFLNLISVFPPNRATRLQPGDINATGLGIVLANRTSFFSDVKNQNTTANYPFSQQDASSSRSTEKPFSKSLVGFFQGVEAAEFLEEEQGKYDNRHNLQINREITPIQRNAASLYWTLILKGWRPKPLEDSIQERLSSTHNSQTRDILMFLVLESEKSRRAELEEKDSMWLRKFRHRLDTLLNNANDVRRYRLSIDNGPQGLLKEAVNDEGISENLFSMGKLSMTFDSDGRSINVGSERIDAAIIENVAILLLVHNDASSSKLDVERKNTPTQDNASSYWARTLRWAYS